MSQEINEEVLDISNLKKKVKQERKNLMLKKVLSNKAIMSGIIILGLLILFSIIGPIVAKFSPLEIDPSNRLQAPSKEHWFGTDDFGRDVFSRVATGARVSLAVGLSVSLLTGIFGIIMGLYSAYYSFLDHILMRISDALLAFPDILLAIAIMAVLGPKPINVVLAVTLAKIPVVARIVRSSALDIKEQTYIEALKVQGASSARVIWKHILPNSVSPLIVQVTYIFAIAIILEAALSFLGAGVPAPNPSWGNILYDGKVVIFNAWWMTIFPGLFIILAVLGLNVFGDGLRDLLDPHANKSK